ncbi:MAG TPA: hypothetical protein VF952_09405, partial [Chloroflexia bacterium]
MSIKANDRRERGAVYDAPEQPVDEQQLADAAPDAAAEVPEVTDTFAPGGMSVETAAQTEQVVAEATGAAEHEDEP